MLGVSGPSGKLWERLSLMRILLLNIRGLGWESKEMFSSVPMCQQQEGASEGIQTPQGFACAK